MERLLVILAKSTTASVGIIEGDLLARRIFLNGFHWRTHQRIESWHGRQMLAAGTVTPVTMAITFQLDFRGMLIHNTHATHNTS